MLEYKRVGILIRKEALELCKNRAFIMYYIYLLVGGGFVMPFFTAYDDARFGVASMLLLVVTVISMIIPSTLISDSFAGEKERKTLETLISTPVSIGQLFLGKICFVVGVTGIILGLIFLLQLLTINGVNLVRQSALIFPYTPMAMFMYWISNMGIACFIATFGGLISLNTRNVKSCNLIVVLVSSPVLAPLVVGLSMQQMSFSHIRLYTYALFIVSLLLFVVVANRYNKIKIMSKL